ncbi:hypothetical protein Y032_0007g3230 [Ancylostoma ceylanicum]|uniref:Uncharacterized protein n=1 Tax=Ancylostoma ceylanicum TaxID=53326 RepID=A0A016VN61_9BILA|nr:hypothetical protein Y032_0007g3230 [Ancylostoma ceylanicum]
MYYEQKEIGEGIELFHHGDKTKNNGVTIAVAALLRDHASCVIQAQAENKLMKKDAKAKAVDYRSHEFRLEKAQHKQNLDLNEFRAV